MILATCQHHILKPYTVQSEFRTVVNCLVWPFLASVFNSPFRCFELTPALSQKCYLHHRQTATDFLIGWMVLPLIIGQNCLFLLFLVIVQDGTLF